METNHASVPGGSRHPSPPLTVLGVVHASLFLASLVVTGVLSGGGHVPSPFDTGAAPSGFFTFSHGP